MAQDGLTEDRAEWQGRTLGDQLDDRGGPEWVRRGGMGCQGGPIRSTEGALCAQASLSCRPPPSKAAGSWGGAPRFHRGQREPLGSSPSRGGTLDLALTPGADGKWRPWKESSGKKATQRDPAPPPPTSLVAFAAGPAAWRPSGHHPLVYQDEERGDHWRPRAVLLDSREDFLGNCPQTQPGRACLPGPPEAGGPCT